MSIRILIEKSTDEEVRRTCGFAESFASAALTGS